MKNWDLDRISKLVMAALAITGGWLSVLFGGWDKAMTILVIFIVLDVISGWCRAVIQKRLSSDESYRGLLKKGLIFLVIIVAAQVDILTNTVVARNTVVTFYCLHEGLSVLENAVASGLPVPDMIKEILTKLNEKKFVS